MCVIFKLFDNLSFLKELDFEPHIDLDYVVYFLLAYFVERVMIFYIFIDFLSDSFIIFEEEMNKYGEQGFAFVVYKREHELSFLLQSFKQRISYSINSFLNCKTYHVFFTFLPSITKIYRA